MAQPYVGEIRMFAGNFAPVGWMFCEGQLLPISENETLFNLIGTTYGGDGQETFGLPDLRGRLPVHANTRWEIGETGGVDDVTLTTSQLPAHTHPLTASAVPGTDANPTNAMLAASPNVNLFREATPSAALSPLAAGPVGGSQPHTNLQPYLCVSFIISLFGIFPTET